MRYFPEIVRILDRFRERRIETMDNAFRNRKESKEFQLYEGIRTGIFHNDSEAADTLYEAAPTAAKYSTMKNRLKIRILNSLFHLNLRRAGFSDAAQAYYLGRKRAFMVHILIGLGARKAAKRMAETTLELAQRFALTDIALAMARELRQHASAMGRMAEYDHYDALLKQLLRAYEEELLSAEYIERITMLFNRQTGARAKFAVQFGEYESKLRVLLNDTSTYNFRLNYHRILVRARSASGHHADIIEGARSGLQFLESAPHLLQKERQGDFWLYQLQSYLGVRNFDCAFEAATQCASFYNDGSNSWFSYSESYFLLLMNTLRFAEAREFYLEVTSNTRYPAQTETMHEHWEIYKFYLNYALKTLPEIETHEVLKRFNYDALLRAVPVARRDKHGLNVAIRIAQILHMVDIRDYHGVTDTMESLDTYRSRYVTASVSQASSLFLRLLHVMEHNSFSYKHCVEKGKHILHRLRTEKFEIVDLEQEMQVLPYEWLWDRLLERLKEQAEQVARPETNGKEAGNREAHYTLTKDSFQ